MNSRRRISAPKLRGQHCIGSNEYFDRAQTGHQNHCRSAQPMSEMGQKPALPRRSIAVRFAPNKQTSPESRSMFMLGLRHASHSTPHWPVIPGLS